MVTNLFGTGFNADQAVRRRNAGSAAYLHEKTHIFRLALNKSEQLRHKLNSYFNCYV